MAKYGWVKVWRKAMENEFCKNDARKLGFWTWCLLKAVTEEGDYPFGNQKVHLKPGQFIFGRKKAAEETGLSEATVYRWLRMIQDLNMIVSRSVNNSYTIVEVINWGYYQGQEKNMSRSVSRFVSRFANTVKEDKKNKKKNSLSKEREISGESLTENEPSRNSYEEWLREEGGTDDSV